MWVLIGARLHHPAAEVALVVGEPERRQHQQDRLAAGLGRLSPLDIDTAGSGVGAPPRCRPAAGELGDATTLHPHLPPRDLVNPAATLPASLSCRTPDHEHHHRMLQKVAFRLPNV